MDTRRFRRWWLLLGVLAAFTLPACTPGEVMFFRSVTGSGPQSVEAANRVCDDTFGAGSGEPGGACHLVASQVVAQAMARQAAESGYQHFDDCRQAVDVLFAGRWDYQRALYVIHRESRYVPTAVSPTGALGCGQLTSGIRNAFLQGPWDDPYWNVLAVRTAVDDPAWGWCHWDVVNYCHAGGEF